MLVSFSLVNHRFYLCGMEELEVGEIKGNHYLHKAGELRFPLTVFWLHLFPPCLLSLVFSFEEKAL